MYNNTLFPTMNPRFVLHYIRCRDDVFDLVAEPPRPSLKMLLSPLTPFFAFFGYFFDRHTDVQAVFRKPAWPPLLIYEGRERRASGPSCYVRRRSRPARIRRA